MRKLILSLLMGMIKHSQITQSNKFAISKQYLKKEVGNGGNFWHADKRQSFYKLVLSFFMEVAIHFQNSQNRKLVIFLQYIKKTCCNYFVFYCDAKHSDSLQGSSHVCSYFNIFKTFTHVNTFSKCKDGNFFWEFCHHTLDPPVTKPLIFYWLFSFTWPVALPLMLFFKKYGFLSRVLLCPSKERSWSFTTMMSFSICEYLLNILCKLQS